VIDTTALRYSEGLGFFSMIFSFDDFGVGRAAADEPLEA
jgi:hypothetical protein